MSDLGPEITALSSAATALANKLVANEAAQDAIDATTQATLAALNPTVSDHTARLAALEAAVAVLQIAATPPAPAPAPPNPLMDAKLTDGGSFAIPAGTWPTAKNIQFAQTITGAGMRQTILDGQGGIGAGHRLALGKGVIHVGAPGAVGKFDFSISDVGFINGGGADSVSDGEAGLYFEFEQGSAHVLRCAFDGGENGLYAAPNARGFLNLLVEKSVFGRNKKTSLADGKSHNNYIQVDAIYDGCLLLTSLGHCIKSRGPTLKVSNSYFRRFGARWIDMPGGTDALSSSNTYITEPGASSNNAFSLYAENDAAVSTGPGSFISTNDTFYFSRTKEIFWINNAASHVEFLNPKVFWIGAVGATPPVVVIQGPGKLTGVTPFVFNASNRVDAAPAIPSDPT